MKSKQSMTSIQEEFAKDEDANFMTWQDRKKEKKCVQVKKKKPLCRPSSSFEPATPFGCKHDDCDRDGDHGCRGHASQLRLSTIRRQPLIK